MVRSAYGSVIAHRGYSARAPENTQAAFMAAIGAGCDMIELDTRLTGDGHAVVLHDDSLQRYGHQGRASELTLTELQHLDAGTWFGGEYAGERFLGLAEALTAIAGRVPVNVELKLEGETAISDRASTLVAAVVGDIETALAACRPPAAASSAPSPVLCSTFSDAVFDELLAQAPQVPSALLVGHLLGQWRGKGQTVGPPLFKRISYLLGTIIPRLVEQGAEGLHVHRSLAGPEVIAAAHEVGLFVRVFTINEARLARWLFDIGVDGVFTDEVESVIEAVRPRPDRDAPN